MKKTVAALAAALAASVGFNAYQELPNAKPAKTPWENRAVQVLEATNAGDWKQACDAAPTAAYGYNDYVMLALQYGETSPAKLGQLCVDLLKGAASDGKGNPVGLAYKILYATPKDAKGEKLVVVWLKWNGQQARTIIFHMALFRVPWFAKTAKCAGKPCPPLRWFVLGST